MEAFEKYILIQQKPLGKNKAILDGLKVATNEVIVALDADGFVEKSWLVNLVEAIERKECDLAISNREPITKTWVTDFYMIRKVFIFKPVRSHVFPNLDWGTPPGSGDVAFRRDFMKDHESHFFDPEVKVGVDALLLMRFAESGGKAKYIEEAVLKTHLPASLKYFLLVESRWLAALNHLVGPNRKESLASIAIIGSLAVMALSGFGIIFALCGLFNLLFVINRCYMFVVGRRYCRVPMKNVLGFVFLSYLYHGLRLVALVRHAIGLSKQEYLHQGQR